MRENDLASEAAKCADLAQYRDHLCSVMYDREIEYTPSVGYLTLLSRKVDEAYSEWWQEIKAAGEWSEIPEWCLRYASLRVSLILLRCGVQSTAVVRYVVECTI